MDIDLGMAMAIPFPIFSNPSVQPSNAQPAAKSKPNQLKGKQAPSKPSKFKGKDLDLDQGVFSEEEDPFPGTAELAELRDSLSRFRSTEEALERAMGLKEQQWNSMRASMKSRNRADSGITLGDDEDDDSKTIVPDITFEKVMSPTQMKPEETNQSLFQSAADILNRLTRNLNPKELQAVTQDSLDQFYTSLKDLETQSGAISPTSPNPNPNEPERVTVEDDSGKEFRHLFDDLETKEQSGFLTKLKFESSLWNSLSGYLKQVFSGYMGYLEATARALVPKSLSFLVWPALSFLVWPALSYLVVLVFIGIITKSVIKTNWERVKDDVKALLDLLGAL